MIAGFSHRSIGIQNGEFDPYNAPDGTDSDDLGIQLASGVVVTRENAHTSGVGAIFDRFVPVYREDSFIIEMYIIQSVGGVGV